VKRLFLALSLDPDLAGRVADPTLQVVFRGELIDKRTEADTLHNAPNAYAQEPFLSDRSGPARVSLPYRLDHLPLEFTGAVR